MKVEEQYQDVLQNLEYVIVAMYHDYPELSDSQVARTLDGLTDAFIAEKIRRPPRNFNLSELEQGLLSQLRAVCEWRLGRAPMSYKDPKGSSPKTAPLTTDEILLCLERIRKSVRKWNNTNGVRGYLNFVKDFL